MPKIHSLSFTLASRKSKREENHLPKKNKSAKKKIQWILLI